MLLLLLDKSRGIGLRPLQGLIVSTAADRRAGSLPSGNPARIEASPFHISSGALTLESSCSRRKSPPRRANEALPFGLPALPLWAAHQTFHPPNVPSSTNCCRLSDDLLTRPEPLHAAVIPRGPPLIGKKVIGRATRSSRRRNTSASARRAPQVFSSALKARRAMPGSP